MLAGVTAAGLLASCGGGGSADVAMQPPNPAWITLSSTSATHTGTASFTTDMQSVALSGQAFISPGWAHCCSGLASDTGVTVTWSDLANATSGAALQVADENLILGLIANDWSATVGLAMGANAITVTATDPNGLTASLTITVVRTPDITPPAVVSTIPSTGASPVQIGTVISAVFSEAVDPATVTASTFYLIDGGGNRIAGTVTYTGLVASFAPANGLNPSTTYTATVTTGVRDLAGNPLAAPVVWQFST